VTLNGLSRQLYRTARASRDINAISRGPKAMGMRVLRKAVRRSVGSGLGRLGL
jgi:hypothetical protein